MSSWVCLESLLRFLPSENDLNINLFSWFSVRGYLALDSFQHKNPENNLLLKILKNAEIIKSGIAWNKSEC